LDVKTFNALNGTNLSHVSMTEIPSFQSLFSSFLSSSKLDILPAQVSFSLPLYTSSKKIIVRALSPVSLDVYDTQNRHTGLVKNPITNSDLHLKEESIPNSYYEEFGEGKYIGLSGDETYRIDLRGLDYGTFTFEVSTFEGDQVIETVSYQDVPVTASSTGTFTIPNGDLSLASLSLDVNGDGIKELTNATSSFVKNPIMYVRLVKTTIQTTELDAKTKLQLLTKFSNIENLLTMNNKWDDSDNDGREPTLGVNEKNNERILRKIDKISLYIQKQLKTTRSKTPKEEKISLSQSGELLNMLVYVKTLVQ